MVNNKHTAETYKSEQVQSGSLKDGVMSAIRSSRAAKWATIGGAVFVSGGAVGLATESAPAVANPNTFLKCNLKADPNKAQLCDETKAQAEKFCSSIARTSQLLLHVKGNYAADSHLKYQIKFQELTPGGCSLAGKEEMTAEEQLRSGPTGTFTATGEVDHFNVTNDEGLNDRHPATINLSETPFNCLTQLAGSAVRPSLMVEWIPNPGWTTAGPNQSTVPGPAQAIC